MFPSKFGMPIACHLVGCPQPLNHGRFPDTFAARRRSWCIIDTGQNSRENIFLHDSGGMY